VQVISDYWPLVVAGASLLVLALVWGVLYYRRRQRGPTLREAINAVSVDRLENIVVPDGMGGEIFIECLLLTGRGLVVLDIREYAGAVFGSDRMDEWTVIGANRRFAFPNPQSALYDRMAALRQFVRDVPVTGHVLFAAGADFSKGRPREVVFPEELERRYGRPDRAEVQRLRDAFAQHWDRVREAAKPAGVGGAGMRL
jgi:hypothetical protein